MAALDPSAGEVVDVPEELQPERHDLLSQILSEKEIVLDLAPDGDAHALVKQILTAAIEKGVPIWNSKQRIKCFSLYHAAAELSVSKLSEGDPTRVSLEEELAEGDHQKKLAKGGM